MEKTVHKFMKFLENERGLTNNTLQSYKKDVEQYIKYLREVDIQSVELTEKSTIASYIMTLQKRGRATSTISRNLASIRSYYQYLKENKKITINPALELESPKVEKKLPQILTIEEIKYLLEQPKCTDLKGYRDKAMLKLLYSTGIRVSELISLDITDVNTEMGFIKCKNCSKERIIPTGAGAIKSLTDYMKNSRNNLIGDNNEKALFVNVNGSRLTRQGFWKIIKQYKNQAHIDKDITPHTLRHSFAAHMFENGVELKTIKEILGHSDISSTQIYAQLRKNQGIH